MKGFTIKCNKCGNEFIAKENIERAVNGEIDVDLGDNYIHEEDKKELFTFLFCWKCCNSVRFEQYY